VTTSKRTEAKSRDHGTEPSLQGSSRDTRTFPFPGIENAGDVRLAALKIRRFEILDEIGRGGHGVVFRANDRILRRPVALKLPRPEVLRSKEMRRRFVGEAQVVAALDHPNIIKVFDAGFEATVCYIAQELCNGPSLAAWLKDHPAEMTAEVAASVMLALARGLEHAHQQGVLHRDLKPANVLLKPRVGTSLDDGAEGSDDPATSGISKLFPYTPKLGDFGICKAFTAEGDITGTRTGMVLGTAAYMPPEQAVGTASELGPQSDVYSLGAILYEMLTGHPPFEGVSSAEVLKQLLIDPPVSVRVTRRDVPAALDAICLKCLEKSTAQRYATAAELADDLRRFLVGEPVRAPRKNSLKSLVKSIPMPRRSIQIAFTLTGWILVMVSLALYVRAPKASPNAGVAFPTGGGETALSTDVHSAFNLWHENAERLRDNPNVGEEMTALLARHIPKPGEVDRRGFDWHYAWRLCHPAEAVGMLPQVASFRAHPCDVHFVAFSRDGTRFATAGKDGTACVWNANTRERVCVCSGHTDEVNWVDFSPDQRWLATASDDHSVKVWDAATGKELFTLSGHQSEVVAVRFSPLGDTLVSGDHQGVLKLWDLATRSARTTKAAHTKRIQSLTWGMSGHLLASIGNDNAVRLWEMPEMGFRSERQTTEGQCAALSPFGDLVACGGSGTIEIDDVHTGGRYATLSEHLGQIESIAFSPDGRQLASCDGRGVLRLWDLGSRKGWSAAPLRYRTDETGKIVPVGLWCVAYSPDGSRLVTSARDGVVEIWDASIKPQWTLVTKNDPQKLTAPLAFSPDGKLLAIARQSAKGGDGLQIWNPSPTRPSIAHEFSGLSARAACFSRDGKELVVGTAGKVEIYNAQTGESRLRIPLTGGGVANAVAFDGSGSLLVLEESNKKWSIQTIDPHTGAKTRALEDACFATAGVHNNGFAASLDGSLLAIAPKNCGQTALCDVSKGEVLPTRIGLRDGCGYLTFAPNNLLAIGSVGGVELWDTRTAKEQAFLSDLGRAVGPLAFLSNGRLLIVVSQEQKAMQLWDVRRHTRLFTLPIPVEAASGAQYWSLAASPDGKQFACAIADTSCNGGVYLFSGVPIESTSRENSSLAFDENSTNGRD
jgi:eukaryotic-like serine/threonine-protein kinase